MGGQRAATVLAIVIVAVVVLVLAAPAGTQVRKPTNANDLQDATTNGGEAFNEQDGYDESTFATTTQPDANASINWTGWNTTDKDVYEELSLTITINASGFTLDAWNYYFDNTTGTTCADNDWFITGTAGSLLGDNPSITNVSVPLPRKQDLSDIEVCLVGTSSASEGGQVGTFDIRTNGTLDTTPPLWANQQQNDSSPIQGDAVKLAAQGSDNLNLSHAVLATNETGTWQNTTAYGSPQQVYVGGEAVWTNFTWSNASLNAGTAVGWRIWYNDTAGNVNGTDILTFTLEDAFLAVTLADPPSALAAVANTTFLLNATVDCMWGDCGNVTGTARYNASSQDPDTPIDQFTGEPFHTTRKENPANCATFLHRGDRCNVTWHVNATGNVGSIHSLDVNMTSNRTAWNATDPVNVEIVAAAIEMVLRFATVDFGSLFVGTENNSAENNSDKAYNISITSASGSNADVWLNGTDMAQEDGDRRIGVSNVSWNATANDKDNTEPLTGDPARIASGVAPGTNVTTFYWIDVPYGLYHDNYTGTLTVTANETQ